MRTILRLSRLSRAPSPGSGFGTALLAVALYAPARCVLHWLGLARERRHLARLDDRLLRRLARRALVGLARTGSSMSNGSGDYVIAFSTAPGVRRTQDAPRQPQPTVANDAMSPLFNAVAEATEEAIVNSLFRAQTMSGHRGTLPALPLERVLPLLRRDPGAKAPSSPIR